MPHASDFSDNPAVAGVAASGIAFRVVEHGPVRGPAEAAAARGMAVSDVVKTIVVRLGEGDYRFVLLPLDRVISWPKLRALLGVARMSMPDAATAKDATGFERGTITPFGSSTAWPVIADERIRGREISLGGGRHGVALAVSADAAIAALDATVADISEPEPPSSKG
ncbi:YbaK/EbsC family protein [Dactylosporangium sp. NPDC000555]|uniref:aminoacyl-tRNA deacylase n=1 Tax=Dactylosporangium sp. NPDC000555 TaxID=3154260 RepID=UPI003325BE57